MTPTTQAVLFGFFFFIILPTGSFIALITYHTWKDIKRMKKEMED